MTEHVTFGGLYGVKSMLCVSVVHIFGQNTITYKIYEQEASDC